VTLKDFPVDYPLFIVAMAGGLVAIGSNLWPKGANKAVEPCEITSVNGAETKFEKVKKGRRSA
jgi:hypothetical protein